MNSVFAEGFGPVFDANSRVLVLGSFPSVKSRAVGFYYGNPQNRFWRTVSGYFGEEVPLSVADKREFLLRRGIALWDVVASCEIVGSSDAAIKNETLADIPSVLKAGKISVILCNGSKSYSLFAENCPRLLPIAVKLPSTSPANPRFSAEVWKNEFDKIFKV